MNSAPPSTKIIVRDLCVLASIGVNEQERIAAQRLMINATLHITPFSAERDDRLDDTINYDSIVTMIKEQVLARHYNLQETLCKILYDRLSTLPDVHHVLVRTAKPDIYEDCAWIGVEMEGSGKSAGATA
ncbi:MAG: dihydroneopterin aldolase [Pseudomonadota bacterium]